MQLQGLKDLSTSTFIPEIEAEIDTSQKKIIHNLLDKNVKEIIIFVEIVSFCRFKTGEKHDSYIEGTC